MHKYKLVEFQFDPEIERTVRTLRKENRNLRSAAIIDDLQDTQNLNPQREIEPVNAQGSQKGQNG